MGSSVVDGLTSPSIAGGPAVDQATHH
ncbi:hypothetical protein A2U01_0075000, partial [Trifolium medium]|nr:hypothetical protein [Trifolium medium]